MNPLPKLVILDRDGVINHDSDDYIKSVDEWVPIPGSLEAIARLNHAGIAVTVATNQSGIGRGMFSVEDLNLMHAKFQHALSRAGGHINGIFFCPHTPEAGCDCRKPKPGLLRAISVRFGMPLTRVPVIGDSKRDAESALAAHAIPILVRTGKGERTFEQYPELHELPWFDDLAGAVDHILEGRAQG